MEIDYSTDARPESKVKEIKKELFDWITKKWQGIHTDFTLKLKELWKRHDFTSKQIKGWIDKGLQPSDYDFANHLKNQGRNAGEENSNLEILREEYEKNPDWKNIHVDYYWQKEWEKLEFNYAETKQWTEAGFSCYKYDKVKEWKDLNFTSEQAKEWLEAGLKTKNSNFADYLRREGFAPEQYTKQNKNAQEWIDYFYPLEKRAEITELDISDKGLKGSLELSNFDNLEELNCSKNYLTDTDLLLSNLNHEKLKSLKLSNNNFSESDLSPFSQFTNLENLHLGTTNEEKIDQGNYNKFYGSLEPLKNLNKLKKLDIANTDINSGIEYLPKSLEEVVYEIEEERQRSEAKVKEINKEKLDNYITKNWLDNNYPKEKRKEIKELSINFKKLKGKLDLSDFENLEELDCDYNKLTNLDLSNCKNIQSLNVNHNKLSDVSFLNQIPNPERLRVLHLRENDISSDLTPFSHFTNLEELKLDSNKLSGSLKHLKTLTNLEILDISNTDVSDDSLENLPNNLAKIYFSSKERSGSKVKEIEKLLKKTNDFSLSDKSDDFNWDEKKESYKKKYSNPQQWLDKRYSNREEIKEINLSGLKNVECEQEGELIIADFPNLKEIKNSGYWWNRINKKINKTTINNCPELEKINTINLENNKELNIIGCSKLKEINCSSNHLNSLKLSDYSHLTELDCSNNLITELNVQQLPNLRNLNCSGNLLTNLDLSKNSQLEELYINDNNFFEQDLSFLEHLINLQKLNLGNKDVEKIEEECKKYEEMLGKYSDDDRFLKLLRLILDRLNKKKTKKEQGIRNEFNGSLESLSKMTKLEILNISSTDIDNGLESLSKSVEKIYCDTSLRKESDCKHIVEQLKGYYDEKEKFYNYQGWKKDAQRWVDKNYPKNDICQREDDKENYGKRREEIINLDTSNKELRGFLNLEDFPNLEKLECYDNQLTSIDISKCLKLKKFNCYKNQLTALDISKNYQLTILVCSENKLENLRLGENYQLTEIYCFNNQLTELYLSSLDSEKLEKLDISGNNFAEQDLSFLSRFTSLKCLQIGTYDKEKIDKGIYNRFTVSLEPLKNMSNLEELDISNTDINEGVEYLPNSITEICYSIDERSESKLKEIIKELKWWENIGHVFTPEVKEEWEEKGFDYEKTKEWVEVGLEVGDSGYAQWLRDGKKYDAEKLSKEENKEKLKEEYKNQGFQNNIQISINDK